MTQEQLQRIEWVQWDETRDAQCPACLGEKPNHKPGCWLAAALRAAPPAPAPELVALVQKWQDAVRTNERIEGMTVEGNAAFGVLLDCETDMLNWTPAAPVGEPARPETAAPTPAPNVEKPVSAVEKVVWIVADYPSGGVRGVYHTQAEAESGIAEIRSYHEDLVRSDFTVQTERIRGSATAAPTPAPTTDLVQRLLASIDSLSAGATAVQNEYLNASDLRAIVMAEVKDRLRPIAAALSSPVGETPEGK